MLRLFRNEFVWLINRLRATFWLLPLVMLVTALGLALATLMLDRYMDHKQIPLLEGKIGPQAAQAILSTIAGSMITVASLIFSLTFVALSLVASQLGPRLLLLFMEDRPTQAMLGLFLATFLYSLLILADVRVVDGDNNVPQIGVLASISFAIIAFVSITFFIHHIARLMQADFVVHQTAQKLRSSSMALLECDEQDTERYIEPEKFQKLEQKINDRGSALNHNGQSGYVQSVNLTGLSDALAERDLQALMLCRPGHFLLRGRPILRISGDEEINDELAGILRRHITFGPQRTREEQVEFEMLALVEIALRALSPGINDPMTANSCIDKIAEALARFLRRFPEHRICCDDEGAVTILAYPQTFEHFFSNSIQPIAHAAQGQPIVLRRLEFLRQELRALATAEPHRTVLENWSPQAERG